MYVSSLTLIDISKDAPQKWWFDDHVRISENTQGISIRWINTNVMELLWNEMESTFPKWSKHSGLSMTSSAHIAKEMKIHSERVHDAARTDSLQTGYFWKRMLKTIRLDLIAQKLCNNIIRIMFHLKTMYLQGPCSSRPSTVHPPI